MTVNVLMEECGGKIQHMITMVNGKEVDTALDKSMLQDGDKVVIKFGGKSKKLFKGVI